MYPHTHNWENTRRSIFHTKNTSTTNNSDIYNMCITIKHRFACCAIKQNKQKVKTCFPKTKPLKKKQPQNQNIVYVYLFLSVSGGKNEQNFHSVPKVKSRLSISSISLRTFVGTDVFISNSPKYRPKKLYFWEWQPCSLSSQRTHGSNLQVF